MQEATEEPFRESFTISFTVSELAPLEEILSIFESFRSMSVRSFRTLSIVYLGFDRRTRWTGRLGGYRGGIKYPIENQRISIDVVFQWRLWQKKTVARVSSL
jgi:hypothetical protein